MNNYNVKSYGSFDKFEIRDITKFVGIDKSTGNVLVDDIDSMSTGKFDLVMLGDDNHTHCLSIGSILWNEHEGSFNFESVGLRYLEYSTLELNRWLIKWCDMKSYEMRMLNEKKERN